MMCQYIGQKYRSSSELFPRLEEVCKTNHQCPHIQNIPYLFDTYSHSMVNTCPRLFSTSLCLISSSTVGYKQVSSLPTPALYISLPTPNPALYISPYTHILFGSIFKQLSVERYTHRPLTLYMQFLQCNSAICQLIMQLFSSLAIFIIDKNYSFVVPFYVNVAC